LVSTTTEAALSALTRPAGLKWDEFQPRAPRVVAASNEVFPATETVAMMPEGRVMLLVAPEVVHVPVATSYADAGVGACPTTR
jgi:hypothetical protein